MIDICILKHVIGVDVDIQLYCVQCSSQFSLGSDWVDTFSSDMSPSRYPISESTHPGAEWNNGSLVQRLSWLIVADISRREIYICSKIFRCMIMRSKNA